LKLSVSSKRVWGQPQAPTEAARADSHYSQPSNNLRVATNPLEAGGATEMVSLGSSASKHQPVSKQDKKKEQAANALFAGIGTTSKQESESESDEDKKKKKKKKKDKKKEEEKQEEAPVAT